MSLLVFKSANICCPNELRNFHRFHMVGTENDGFSSRWWSHDYGMLHVIAIDIETDFTNASSNSSN
jgi:acid phosphatase